MMKIKLPENAGGRSGYPRISPDAHFTPRDFAAIIAHLPEGGPLVGGQAVARSANWTLNLRGSRPVNPLNCGDRNNCFRPVIRFSSRAEKAISRYVCKVLSFQVLSKLHESCTKGNIQPCKPLCFQEELETQPLFAFSRTAATTRTPQTKDSRYPVFIRGNHGCYQNN
jgi:hypothetical protein